MGRLWNVLQRRAGLVLGGAVLAMLLLPAAVAGAYSPTGMHRTVGNVYGASGGGDGDSLAIFLGVIAACIAALVIVGLVVSSQRGSRRRERTRIQRKPAGVAS
jgi:hypothetical protein